MFQVLLILALSSSMEGARVHFALSRRGGRLATSASANLTYLAKLADDAEQGYIQTKLQVDGNKVTRIWATEGGRKASDEDLMHKPGRDGAWYLFPFLWLRLC